MNRKLIALTLGAATDEVCLVGAQLAGDKSLTSGVATVPDETKGERLVVLHRIPLEALPELLRRLQQSGLPNQWIPKANPFSPMEQSG